MNVIIKDKLMIGDLDVWGYEFELLKDACGIESNMNFLVSLVTEMYGKCIWTRMSLNWPKTIAG